MIVSHKKRAPKFLIINRKQNAGTRKQMHQQKSEQQHHKTPNLIHVQTEQTYTQKKSLNNWKKKKKQEQDESNRLPDELQSISFAFEKRFLFSIFNLLCLFPEKNTEN